jgi:hypothetical protein
VYSSDLTGRADFLLYAEWVGDHKTCSTLRYIPDSYALSQDVQALTYGWALDRGRLLWRYYHTRAPQPALEVRAELGAAAVAVHERRVTELASQVRSWYDDRREPRDCPTDTTKCKMYGGCPYRAWCAARPSLFDLEKMKGKTMDQQNMILEQLRKRKASAKDAIVPPPDQVAVNPPRPAPEPETKAEPAQPKADAAPAVEAKPAPKAAPKLAPKPAPEAKAAPKLAPQPAPDAKVAAPQVRGGLTIYVDCIPQEGARPLIDLLEVAIREVVVAFGLDHWATAEYGKGPALLAAKAAQVWSDEPPRGEYYAPSSSTELRAVRAVLERIGARFVLGLR